MIVQGAHGVRPGEPPSFAREKGCTRDLFLMEGDDPVRGVDVVSRSSSTLAAPLRGRPGRRHPGVRAGLPGEVGIDAINDACARR